MNQPIVILNYHTISDTPERGLAPYAVRPEEFARHLDLLVARNCTTLTVSELIDYLDGDRALAPGTVLITFDDGYEDNLTVAAPLLSERGMSATVFAATGLLPGCPGGSVTDPPGPMLPWECLLDLEAAGIEVGSHSHSHPELDVLSRAEAADEIGRSKVLLEEALGHPVHSFAYPHGYGTNRLQQEVRRCGFRSACGVRNALSHRDDNRWLLSRVIVRSTTTGESIDELLNGAGAPLARRREPLRTKAWRLARRARSPLLPSPAWSNGLVTDHAATA